MTVAETASRSASLMFVVLLAAWPLPAQCATPDSWAAAGTCAAPAGDVAAMAKWDPDGPGPLGVHVVCGGSFAHAGSAAAANVALYDPVARTWSAIGAGFDGPVYALAVLPNGELVAGGAFAQSGTQATMRVARWNGTAWTPLGAGVGAGAGDLVAAMAVLPSGTLVVGGAFAVASGVPAANIAQWNGSAWSPLGSGIAGVPAWPVPPPVVLPVTNLGVRSNGDLIVGGQFTTAGGVPAHCIARWNGAWSTLGFGPANWQAATLAVLANDDVVVSRSDPFAGSYDVVRWNGVTGSVMGGAFALPCSAFCELANGTLLAHSVDYFSALGELWQWTGLAWAPVATQGLTDPASALLELGANDLLLASARRTRGILTVQRLVNGTWQAPAAGLDGWVEDIAAADDEVVMGGWFHQVGSTPANGVAVRQSGAWSALGGGVDGPVQAVHRASNGDWIVAGSFTQAGTVPVHHIARWDGSQWQPIGDPLWPVLAVAELPDGDLVASTIGSTVLRWNGAFWSQLGSFIADALAVLPNGDLIAGCRGPGPAVQRYVGPGSWSPLGGLQCSWGEGVITLRVLANGDVLAGGLFGSPPLAFPDSLARWDGVAWTALGQGVVTVVSDIDVLPNGDWLVTHASRDSNGQPLVTPSRWNGSTWTPVTGLDVGRAEQHSCLAITDAGEIVCVGTFGAVQGIATGGLASRFAGCPAMAAPAGPGCAGAAGPVVLTLQSRPWLGDAYRARTTGLPVSSIALHVFGLTAVSLPLASVLPQGLPGCTLHVSPDLLFAALPIGGEVAAMLAIPSAPALIGASFHHQVVPFELGVAGNILAVTSSNALQLTIGSW